MGTKYLKSVAGGRATIPPQPPGAKVFTLWLSVLCMRSKAWLAAPVLIAHVEVTKKHKYFFNGSKT